MNPTQKQFSLNRGASRKQIPISSVRRVLSLFLALSISLPAIAQTAPGGAALVAKAAALEAAGKYQAAGTAYHEAKDAFMTEQNYDGAGKALGKVTEMFQKELSAPAAPPRFAVPAAPTAVIPPALVPPAAPAVAAAPAALAGKAPTKEIVEKVLKDRWDRPMRANHDKVILTLNGVKFGQAYVATLKEVQVLGIPEGAMVTPARIDYTKREYNYMWTSVGRWPHIEAVVFKDKFSEWTLYQTGGSTEFTSTKEPAEKR